MPLVLDATACCDVCMEEYNGDLPAYALPKCGHTLCHEYVYAYILPWIWRSNTPTDVRPVYHLHLALSADKHFGGRMRSSYMPIILLQ